MDLLLDASLRLIHEPVRLRLMGLLVRHRDVSSATAADALAVSRGNLASHVEKLEAAGLITTRKVLLRSGFEARVAITPKGAREFRRYLAALRGFFGAVET